MPSVSKSQQRLMGAAYAWAKGYKKDAPESIKKIAKSFLKKGKRKGLKNLRDFASTKHKGLVDKVEKVSENHILRFNEF
jgi:hypothetical protein